jgi:selenocysteine lyase/cysteine desulfurase
MTLDLTLDLPPAPATTDGLTLAAPRPWVRLPDGREVPFAQLDYAATAPAVTAATTAVRDMLGWYGSVHRGAGPLSQRSTAEYERSRAVVAEFLGCRADDHVVFTRNTTDALNLLARAVPADTLGVTFLAEHHASLLPWRDAVRLPVPASADEAASRLDAALRELRAGGCTRPILVVVTGASNVTGEVWPVPELAAAAHRHGARLAVDAAQLAPHRPVDLAAWDADYLALSGHKLYAPFGVGVLAGRADWLDQAPPYLAGGGASRAVAPDASTVDWCTGPARHEAGTPNLLGAVALAAVATALRADPTWRSREAELSQRLWAGLSGVPGVVPLRCFGPDADRVGIVSFVVDGQDSAALAAALGERHGIGVRDGLFCAHPLTRELLARAGRPGARTAVRASLGLGVRAADIDRLIAALAGYAAR